MLKKYHLGLFLCLFSFSIIRGQSCLCDPKDDQGGYIWYSVTAPSGLTLRAGPNRSTAKLDAIPFGEEVLFCGNTGVSETIEGKSGSWVKVTWADKTGYLFNGFLTPIYERKIRMVIPNAGADSYWESMELAPEMKWQALADMDTASSAKRKRKSNLLSSVDLKIGRKKVDSTSPTSRFLENGVLNLTIAPFAIFSGFNLLNGVSNQVRTPIKLLPGEIATFSTYDRENQIARRYVISAEGKVIPNTKFGSGDYNGPIERIENYKINMYQQVPKLPYSDELAPWNIQKLADCTLTRPGESDVYDMDVLYIYFAGDLDGDHQLDLILARLNGIAHSYQLYLSSKKLPGFLLRYVAIWTDTAC
jgi:hypothetical protein